MVDNLKGLGMIKGLNPVEKTGQSGNINKPGSNGTPAFANILADALKTQNEVRFSAHASKKLDERSIAMAPGWQNRLNSAVQKAAAKGARDTLVMLDDIAMIVNVPNRTVVTAVEGNQADSQVFTNIDSAVIA
jgi:flagellar operon protein